MTRLQDLLPAGTEAEWLCGHVAGAVCAECHRQLLQRISALADENNDLAAENDELREKLAERERHA